MTTAKHSLPALPPLYTAAEVAAALRCSEWWVKEQARQGRIPFTMPGGSYRFTASHFTEIQSIYESRPAEVRSVPTTTRRRLSPAMEPAVRLVARTPRRALRSPKSDAA